MSTSWRRCFDRTDEKRKPHGGDSNPAAVKLRRRLGLREVVVLTSGTMIGSGIFLSVKGALARSGSTGMALVVWIGCGLFSLLGGTVYGELGSTHPLSGGSYEYLYWAYGSLPAFLYFWTGLILRGPVGTSIASTAIAKYILQPIVGVAYPLASEKLIALCVMTMLTILNAYSVKWTVRIISTCFYMKTLALIIIIVTGLVYIGKGRTESFEDAFAGTTDSPADVGLALYNGLFAYSGWGVIVAVAEEVVNPSVNIPLGMAISVFFVTTVYVLTNVGYYAVLGEQGVLSSEAVAMTFGSEVFGPGGFVMAICVVISVVGFFTTGIMTSSRYWYQVSRRGHIPSVFSFIHVRHRTPIVSMFFSISISSIFIWVADSIMSMIEYYGFIRYFITCCVVSTLPYTRWKYPNLKRPFKMPIVFPLLYMLLNLVLALLPVYKAPLQAVISVAIVSTGVPIWYFLIHRKKPQKCERLMDKITLFLQKLLYVVQPEFNDLADIKAENAQSAAPNNQINQ